MNLRPKRGPSVQPPGFGFHTWQTHVTWKAPWARGAGVSFFAFCLFPGQATGVGFFGWAVERFGYAGPLVVAGAALALLAWQFRRSLRLLKPRAVSAR